MGSPFQPIQAGTVLGAVSAAPQVAPLPRPWRPALESVALPTGAILVALALFGVFCAAQGASPIGVFQAIYKAAFGSWYSFQNTLVRAAPLMLTALCTALPARLGLVVIGNEGALVLGGLGAAAAGLGLAWAPPVVAIGGKVRFKGVVNPVLLERLLTAEGRG